MPKVPTLQGARVQENSTKVGRLNVPVPGRTAFGGGNSLNQVAQTVGRINLKAQKIAQEEESKADQIAILDADQKLSALETKTLYDPQSGAMNTRGKDSFTLGETVIPEFNKQAEEIEKTLNSDFQKLSFRKMMAQRNKFMDRQIGRHVSGETKKYDESVTKSYVANEMNAAIQNFHDPERIALSLERQKGALHSYADRNGLDDETIKVMMSETESKTHSSVVSKLMNGGSVRQAQAYYKTNKDNITGQDRIRVDKALKAGVLQADSQSLSDKIVSKNPSNMSEALADARKIDDPDKRDETVRRVKSRFADMRAADAEDSRQSFDTAYNSLEQNGGDIDAIPKDVWVNMAGVKKESIKKIAASMRSGVPVQTQFAAYYDLEQLSGNPSTRNKFLQTNLNEYTHLISTSDLKILAKRQSNYRNGKGNKELDGIETKGSIVKSTLAAGGISTGKDAGTDEIKQANLFKRKVDELVISKQESTGKKVTNEELREIADNLMVEAITDNGYFGFFKGKKKIFELSQDDRPMIQIDDIPSSELDEIKSALRRLNIPANDEKILELYSEKLNRIRSGNG